MDIRKLLNIINENQGNVNLICEGMKVMTLPQFLEKSGIEPKKVEKDESSQEVDEGESGNLLTDVGKWYDRYLDNEDWNRHSENVLHVAKLVGDARDIKQAQEILDKHKKLGHIPSNLYQDRAELDKKLWPKAFAMVKTWAKNNPKKAQAMSKRWGHELFEAEKLGGVSARPFAKDELQSYLGRIEQRAKEKGEKYKLPYIHRSNIVPIKDEEGKEYDLKKLAALITERPKKILKQNEKMKHSDGSATIYFNIGLPALKGLAFDEDKGEFVIIDTCPGAGQCKTFCYAMKGGYIQYSGPSTTQSRLLNYLYNDPDGFMQELSSEIGVLEKKYNKKNTKLAIRWHDAGDFFSPEYLDRAYKLAAQHPNTDFYAYTKLASVAKADRPDNFKINFSMGALPAQEKQIDFAGTKNSRVVPDALFKDLVQRIPDPEGKPDKKGKVPTKLVYKDEGSINALKQRLAAKYSVEPKSILTYDEMMDTPVSKEKNKYNVIVKPGDGDDSANRNDVLNTFLLIH